MFFSQKNAPCFSSKLLLALVEKHIFSSSHQLVFLLKTSPVFHPDLLSHILSLMKHPWTTIPSTHPPTFYSHIFSSSSQNPHLLETSIPFLCFSLNPLSPTTARFLVLQASNSFIAHPSASLHPQPPPWQGGHLFCSTCPMQLVYLEVVPHSKQNVHLFPG